MAMVLVCVKIPHVGQRAAVAINVHQLLLGPGFFFSFFFLSFLSCLASAVLFCLVLLSCFCSFSRFSGPTRRGRINSADARWNPAAAPGSEHRAPDPRPDRFPVDYIATRLAGKARLLAGYLFRCEGYSCVANLNPIGWLWAMHVSGAGKGLPLQAVLE